MGLSRIWATKYDIFTWEMGLSRVQSSKNQLFPVRNGSVTGVVLIMKTCHGEKWGCHGSGLQNMVFLKWEMVLSRVQSSKNQLVPVRNGSVTGVVLIMKTCHGEKWGCHGSGLQNMVFLKWEMGLSRVQSSETNLSRWEMDLSRVFG